MHSVKHQFLALTQQRAASFRQQLHTLSSRADEMVALDAAALRALYGQLIDHVTVWPDQPPAIAWLT